MNCVSPPELDDRQLLTYVDGEADRNVATHLEQCSYCLEKARQLARLQKRLTRRLYRLTCPSPAELGEYHLGMLDAAQGATIAQHLQECPHCTREVAQLRSYLSELAPTVEFSPLERVRVAAVKVLVARLIGGGQEDARLALAPAFAGIRGDARGPITLEADGILIVLDVQPTAEERVTILGQIASDDQDRWTGAVVELRQADELRITATVDDLGAFRCEAFPPGPTEILITPSSGNAVLVPNVEIVV